MGHPALQLLIPVLLALGLMAAVDLGYRLGRRRTRGRDGGKPMETGAVQGAMLGLLGLLLGFSFAGAAGRFMERQDLITAEANAITTAYLRAELLADPHASDLRTALSAYVEHRVEASRNLRNGIAHEDAERIDASHREIWAAAIAGVRSTPVATVAVLAPVNSVIDYHATRFASGRKHLPTLVVSLLLSCSILTLGVIGYGCALAKARNTSMNTMIALLIAAALWTTFDLDRPRIGLIQLSDHALEALDLKAKLP